MNAGRFTRETSRDAVAKRGKRKKGQPGLAGEVRRHRKTIVAGLLKLATNGGDSARARALSELARIGWGSPASASEMGAVERVDGGQVTGLQGYQSHYGGVVVLPASETEEQEARESLLAKFKRLTGPPDDWSKLSPEQLEQMKALLVIVRGGVDEELPYRVDTTSWRPAPPVVSEPVAPSVDPRPDANGHGKILHLSDILIRKEGTE